MNKNIILAVPFGLLATALVLSLVSPITADGIVGLCATAVLVGIAALDYGTTRKPLVSRS
jgi:hypothetical protein